MIREFHLSPAGVGGVSCDADGAFVGAIPILTRLRNDGRDEWRPRKCEELSKQIGMHYGLPIDMSSKTGGLKAIAKALNEGDVVRAQIATVLLGIPDPPRLSKAGCSREEMIKFIRELHWSGLIKWDPDEHPRWPAGSADGKGGEFAPKGEGGETGAASRAGAVDRTKPHNPDGAHKQPAQRANDTDGSAKPDTAHRSARIQLADNARSDAPNDPTAEAAARAAAAARHNPSAAHSQAKPVDGNVLWQALSSRSHEAKAALLHIGRAEVDESKNNFAMATDEANAIAHVLRTYAEYRAQLWLDDNGRPVEIPAVDIGQPVAAQAELMARLAANLPLTRPATNADWIDPLINLASVAPLAAGPAFRLAGPAAEVLDAVDATTIAANDAKNVTTLDQLTAAAGRAAAKIGPGSGRFHGTAMHSAFRVEVDTLANPNLFTEQSYLNGIPVDYGTPGSVRLDVVEGPLKDPATIYDLKTGNATLTPSRIRQIQSHLPPTTNSVPIKEVRP